MRGRKHVLQHGTAWHSTAQRVSAGVSAARRERTFVYRHETADGHRTVQHGTPSTAQRPTCPHPMQCRRQIHSPSGHLAPAPPLYPCIPDHLQQACAGIICTAQHSTAQHNIAQHSRGQEQGHSMAQLNSPRGPAGFHVAQP
jgi:hypothetical protein